MIQSKQQRDIIIAYASACVGFALLAMFYTFVVRGFSLAFLMPFLEEVGGVGVQLVAGDFAMFTLPPLLLALWMRPKLVLAVVAINFSTVLLHASFMTAKAVIPIVNPFWADPFLATWDRFIFAGQEPYVLAQSLSEYVPNNLSAILYSYVWGGLSIIFPMYLIAAEKNLELQKKYLKLFFLAWPVLGLGLATVMSSAGPIYFDRLYGGEAFAPLAEGFKAIGLGETAIAVLQDTLWESYAADGGLQESGMGISAFPSLHVANCTIWACYLTEKSRKLMPVGVAYVAIIWFLSVYTGWHYAVDGFVSIALVVLGAVLLGKKAPALASALNAVKRPAGAMTGEQVGVASSV